MKRWRRGAFTMLAGAPIVALLAYGLTKDPRYVASPLPGREAPLWSMETLQGDTLRLKDLRGQVVVMNFWASWCLACIGEHPLFIQASQKYKNQQVHFVGVVYQDTRENALAWLKDRGGDWSQVLDAGSRTAIDFGLAGVPETFFIGRDGRVAYKQVGPITQEALDTWIPRLLSAPTTPSPTADLTR